MRKYAQNKNSLEYRLLKHRYRILLKSRNNIDNEVFRYDRILEYHATESRILEILLSFDEELKPAYNTKEEYLIFDQVTKEEAAASDRRKVLNSVIKRFRHTQMEESIHAAQTLEHWKEEIFNSFTWINDRRISNIPREGKNNYVKKILFNANNINFQHSIYRIISNMKHIPQANIQKESNVKKTQNDTIKNEKERKSQLEIIFQKLMIIE